MWHSSGIMLRPPPFSLCTSMNLRVVWNSNMFADTTIACNDIKELVRMTKEKLLSISDWLRVNK